MEDAEVNNRLVAVGEKIKAKGWSSAHIQIFVSYLAMFDRELGPHDPMIAYGPSIQASVRNRYGHPTSHEFVRDGRNAKTLDEALDRLEAAADAMPTMAEETARIEGAKAKLTDEERRLLGVGH